MSERLGLQRRIAVGAGTLLLRALATTWRIRVIDGHHLDSLRAARKGFTFTLWHGQLLPLIWHHRGRGVMLMISEHRDGEMIARVAQSLGYGLIRGSTTRGAGRALLAAVSALEADREIAITPDGPKGPARSFAPGALVAAYRSRTPLLPVSAATNRAWRLGSWDRFMIPMPFAKVTIAYGDPIIPAGATMREASANPSPFEFALEQTAAKAGERL